jgi:D-glycero-alpha-D-manno-heptose-7-phosphate kinase
MSNLIICKSVYRCSLSGGSCDYPDFFTKFGCLIIVFTLNLGVYICLRPTPDILGYRYIIHYSQSEKVDTVDQIKHNGVRGTLRYLNEKRPIEAFSFCDLPSRTGIGSSSTFIVGFLHALYELNGIKPSKRQLAANSIFIERELLAEPGGIQDSIHAAYGGFNTIDIKTSGEWFVKPLPVSQEFLSDFRRHILLLYVGETRDSFAIAGSHTSSSLDSKKRILEQSYDMYAYFTQESIFSIGHTLYQSWLAKRAVSDKISNEKIDGLADKIMQGGAWGLKLLGSGGSGFFLVVAQPSSHDAILEKSGLRSVDFEFDWTGSRIIQGIS